MKFRLILSLSSIFLFSLIFSCNTASERREDSLINTWAMKKFIQNESDVSARFNPNNDRKIRFYEDGTYKAEGGPFPPTSGKYSIDNDILLMESNEGPSENASWKFSINKDKMIFKRVKSNMPWETEIHYEIE